MSITRTIPYTETEVQMPELADVVEYLDHQIATGNTTRLITMNDHTGCLGALTTRWLNPEYAPGSISYGWHDARFMQDHTMGWAVMPVEAGEGVGDALQNLALHNPYPSMVEARGYITEWMENGPTYEDGYENEDEDEDEDEEDSEEFQPLAIDMRPSTN